MSVILFTGGDLPTGESAYREDYIRGVCVNGVGILGERGLHPGGGMSASEMHSFFFQGLFAKEEFLFWYKVSVFLKITKTKGLLSQYASKAVVSR